LCGSTGTVTPRPYIFFNLPSTPPPNGHLTSKLNRNLQLQDDNLGIILPMLLFYFASSESLQSRGMCNNSNRKPNQILFRSQTRPFYLVHWFDYHCCRSLFIFGGPNNLPKVLELQHETSRCRRHL